jgi:hypothetical protein
MTERIHDDLSGFDESRKDESSEPLYKQLGLDLHTFMRVQKALKNENDTSAEAILSEYFLKNKSVDRQESEEKAINALGYMLEVSTNQPEGSASRELRQYLQDIPPQQVTHKTEPLSIVGDATIFNYVKEEIIKALKKKDPAEAMFVASWWIQMNEGGSITGSELDKKVDELIYLSRQESGLVFPHVEDESLKEKFESEIKVKKGELDIKTYILNMIYSSLEAGENIEALKRAEWYLTVEMQGATTKSGIKITPEDIQEMAVRFIGEMQARVDANNAQKVIDKKNKEVAKLNKMWDIEVK